MEYLCITLNIAIVIYWLVLKYSLQTDCLKDRKYHPAVLLPPINLLRSID